MKRNILFAALFCLSACFSSCFKNNDEDFYLKDFRAEFQDAVINNNAPGENYPLLAALRTDAGLKSYQVNLMGGLKPTEQVLKVKILDDETTAVQGVHYTLPKGLNITIPANSAFGYLDIEIPALTNTNTLRVVFELESSSEIKASANHKRIGIQVKK